MAWFIKTEQFTPETNTMGKEFREKYLEEHRTWVKSIAKKGIKIFSGYLADENTSPGGGGLLLIESNSFQNAKSIIINDPLILAGLVTWEIQEWIIVEGDFSAAISEEMIS